LQKVRPKLFLQDEKAFLSSLKKGNKILELRMLTAHQIMLPHLLALKAGKRTSKVDGFVPTVDNLSGIAKVKIGWHGDSVSTFKSRMWGPTRRVAHVAAAFVLSITASKLLRPKQHKSLLQALWSSHELLYPNLLIAERYRMQLPHIKQFRIKENQTIKFIPT
jgi:hypothetical protein